MDKDLTATILISTFLLLIIFLLPDIGFLRVFLGLLFVLFLPGYVFIATLFPGRNIDWIERVALSFGLSIAIVPLIGLGLNYTPFGIRLIPILLSLYIFIIVFSILAYVRRLSIPGEERFQIPSFKRILELLFPSQSTRFDKILSIILVISILLAVGMLIFVIITPKEGEHFTEFYILGGKGKAYDYPEEVTIGERNYIIIGLSNHEYKTINYTIEIWLVNSSFEDNRTIIHHMYYIDSINVTLDSIPPNIEGNWTPQWEKVYNFSINKSGRFKLWFLLFKEPVSPPVEMEDYVGTDYEERIIDAVEGKIQSLNLNIIAK
mgnify:CR=1 FL=1